MAFVGSVCHLLVGTMPVVGLPIAFFCLLFEGLAAVRAVVGKLLGSCLEPLSAAAVNALGM